MATPRADHAIFDGARGGLMPVTATWFKAAYAPAGRIDQLVSLQRRPGVALPPASSCGASYNGSYTPLSPTCH